MWKFSVKKPYTIIVAVLLILILGVVSWSRMSTDLLPSISLPYVVVMTGYTGASPEEVELVVTKPIEQAMATLDDIENISSISSQESSVVILEFNDSVNMESVTVDTREKLDMISSYWSDSVKNPIITKISPDMLPILTAAVDQEGSSREDLTRLINQEIGPKLEGVNGVASVSVNGGIEKEIQVVLSQEKIDQINEKIKKSVEDQFDQAKQELVSAQQKLESGKQELEQQLSSLTDGMTDADQGLLNGKLELLKVEIQLSQSESELQSKESEIQQLETLVTSMETSLTEMQNDVNTREGEVAALDQEAFQLKQEIDQEEAALKQQRADLEAQIQKLKEKLDLASLMPNQIPQVMEAAAKDPQLSGDESKVTNAMESAKVPETTKEAEKTKAPETVKETEKAKVPETVKPVETTKAPETTKAAETTKAPETTKAAPTKEPEVPTIPETIPLPTVDPEEIKQLEQLQNQLQEIAAKEQQLALKKSTYEVKKASAESAHTVLDSSRDTLNQFQEQVSSTKQQLNDAKAALADAKDAIAQGGSLITDNQEELKEKEKELNRQKEEAQKKLDDASNEMKEGEKTLDEQLKKLDESREKALQEATLDGKITEDAIGSLLQAQNFNMPAGYVTQDGKDYLVRVGDKITDISELKNLILFAPDIEGIDPIMLEDVAEVFYTDNSAKSYAKVNGNDGLVLSIQKQNTYSTAQVSHLLADEFQELEGQYENLRFTSLMDQGTYIDIVINSVLDNLLMGGILAIIILMMFLKDIKPTVIIACSIPISVIFAIVLMYFSGVTLNVISLSGLAVGVGMLVDNSVVVIENIYRLRGKGASVIQAAVSGAAQVAGAITSSTLTTVCVFLPIVFVEGITRQLFVDMALTIAYSLLASLIIALTLVPMMASKMLKKTKEKQHKFQEKVMKWYDGFIRGCLERKWIVILAAIAMLVLSILAAFSKGTAFMPESDSIQLTATLKMPEGAVLEDTTKVADEAMEQILTLEDVDTVGAIMSSGGMMQSSSENSVSFYVVLKEDKKHTSQEVATQIQEVCGGLDGEVTAKGSNMDMSALGGSGISVNIYGQEIDRLTDIAKEVADIVKDTEGTVEVSDGINNPTPELRIVIDKEKAIKQGLTVAQAYMDLKTKLAVPISSTDISQGGKSYSTIVTSGKKGMPPDDLREYVFTVSGQDGSTKQVALKDIAEIVETETLSSIDREKQKRMLTVSAGIDESHNIGLVSQELDKKLKDYQVPEGYSIEMAGENETINESMSQLVLMLLLGIAFIYFIMVAQFQSFLSPFIVMFTIPLAFTGGFLGLFLTNNEVSVIAVIGFVMLAGIVVNNGIVLVDYTNQLRLEGTERREAIVEAGKTRMRPILMTAITTILGLLTMALGVGMGADMMQPIAIVTIGGLSYATLMTLFIIPVLYDIFSRKKMKAIEEKELEILED